MALTGPLTRPLTGSLTAALTVGEGVGAWWLSGSALDLDFANQRGYNSTALSSRTPDSILTYTSPSPKLVYGDDGVLRYAPHNLFLNSGAPATQNVTLITGFSYTVTVTGSGSLAGSSGASGTASAGSPATFVATGTTGTFTLTGSLTTIQINRSPAHAGYIPTTTAAVYSLPIDHNPTTFAPLGVLIEEQRVNLLTYSEQFDNAAWTKNNASSTGAPTITANVSTAAPDGTLTADEVDMTDNSGMFVRRQGVAWTGGVQGTVSAYVYRPASGGASAVRITTNNTLAWGTGLSQSFPLVAGEWTRIVLSGLITSTGTLVNVMIGGITDAGAADAAITGKFYIWGAQLEVGAFPTSYIPTVASQVTRAADQVSILTSAFGYNAAEGTFVAEFDKLTASARGVAMVAGNTTVGSGTGIAIDGQNNGFVRAFIENVGSLEMLNATLAVYTANVSIKGAVAYASNNAVGSAAGNIGTVDTSVVVPTVNNLQVGANRNTVSAPDVFLNGHIKRLTYFPVRKTNAELQVLST